MSLERLIEIMKRLRDPVSGCEWDSVQTFATIAPYTIEEAYEVADACQRGDMAELKDELGDLLLQVVFHSRMAEEAGHFALGDVIDSISEKMERRHPHIFGDAEHGGHHLWEEIKAVEREKSADASALAGVAKALPALERAQKLQRRVQTSPRIMKVAVPWLKHSWMFGQLASSHTVTSRFSRSLALSCCTELPDGMRTRIQLGLRRVGASANCTGDRFTAMARLGHDRAVRQAWRRSPKPSEPIVPTDHAVAYRSPAPPAPRPGPVRDRQRARQHEPARRG